MSIGIFLTTIFFVFLSIRVKESRKGTMALLAISVNSAISSFVAVNALRGQPYSELFYGGFVFGEIPVRMDSLSSWFILLMNFTSITSVLYGRNYMKHYTNQPANLSIHYASLILIHFSMIGIYCLQNTLAFLCVWEMMAICSFLLVIFEHEKSSTLKAGINYLVQAHIGIVFLMIGFIWVSYQTDSFNFDAIRTYSSSVSPSISFALFLCFFVGFAIKAGFVPFHTWLPHAHPAAPSHISGLMSGVIIKLGIFGILKMLLLIQGIYLWAGYFLLIISVVSGVYGVMLAIVQHNVKKLLAYHSVENIGIIGIGIGLGAIGLGLNNSYLAFAGFAGALLHTLNHSLFKSVLFYCSGTVYQSTKTLNIEQLGGLIKKMPQTTTVFLIAALSICGLPPFNGFISEFLIYSGLFTGIFSNSLAPIIMMISSIFGLVIIGGLAMLCFTKAFGMIFLGTERQAYPLPIQEAVFLTLLPKYFIILLIVAIGVIPQFFIGMIANPVSLFTGESALNNQSVEFVSNLQTVSIAAWALILLSLAIFGIRKKISSSMISASPTWGCGYIAPGPKLQYTANSFVRSYRKLAKPLLMMNKKENELKGIFPNPVHSFTHPYDKLEAVLIDLPLKYIKAFLRIFRFLQNGNPQFYILYGILFILFIILIPLFINLINYFLEVLIQIKS